MRWNWWTKMRKWIQVNNWREIMISTYHYDNIPTLKNCHCHTCLCSNVEWQLFRIWDSNYEWKALKWICKFMQSATSVVKFTGWKKKPLICSPAPIYNRPKLKQDRNCASSTPTDCRKVKISYFLCPGTTLFDRWKLPGSQLENCMMYFCLTVLTL